MSLMKFRNRRGFTLIEMMIVIAVIAILAAVIIPKTGIVQDTAKESGVEANARIVQGVIENILPRYSADDDDTTTHVDGTDFRNAIKNKLQGEVKNPITTSTDVVIDDDATEAPAGGAAVVISTASAGVDKLANAGVVWVQIEDKIGSITITSFGKDGKEIPNSREQIK